MIWPISFAHLSEASQYLATLPNATAATAKVKKNVPSFIKLTPGDQEPSETRPGEELWQQVVGNIVSHRHDSLENFVNRGLLSYAARKLSITQAGVAYLRKLNAHP